MLFTQERVGRNERIFRIYKFRSMRDAAYAGEPDADRLTGVGQTMRKLSLDEIPQLWNVLRGDMSLVGPRPLLVRYLARYAPEQRKRHAVVPGITGLTAVSGRNALSWDQKFAYDVEYVARWSPVLDSEILVRTLTTVLSRRGVAEAEGIATATEFMGRQEPA